MTAPSKHTIRGATVSIITTHFLLKILFLITVVKYE